MDHRETQRQRVVWAQARHSHLMDGDAPTDPAYDGSALPALLQAGWRITGTVAASSGVYFILTDSGEIDPGRVSSGGIP